MTVAEDAVPIMDLHSALFVVLPLALLTGALIVVIVMGAHGRWAGRDLGTGPFVRHIAAAMDVIDARLERWYARMGVWMGSLIIAAALVVVVFFYVNGGTEPVSHGICYAALSEAPFDTGTDNPFRNRILAPLIGWVLHLRGPLFVLVPWLFLVGLLTVVNVWCRREGAGSLLALSITLGMVFSPVAMHALALPGFIETASYFLIAVALLRVRDPIVSCACMALAVMAHEASVFIIPAWLMAVGCVPFGMHFRRILLLVAMLVPYAAYRWWVVQHAGEGLSVALYFSGRNMEACLAVGPMATVAGAFAVFRLHWLVLAVPLFWAGLRNGRAQWAMLLSATVGLSLLIAFDTTRMLCWAFPLLALGGVELGRGVGRRRATALFLLAWALNFLIAPYSTSGAESHRLNNIRDHVKESPLTSTC